jgi:hypothetical protein
VGEGEQGGEGGGLDVVGKEEMREHSRARVFYLSVRAGRARVPPTNMKEVAIHGKEEGERKW